MNPIRRLARHLSFANVVACLALFAALGGSAYAGTKINGNSIAKHSIGGNKLKNETITSKQIKKGSLNSSVINLSTLATVPSAQTAATATSAGSATTAGSANSAKTADSATTAGRATSAETADTATSAGHAATAGDAETVGGETAAELTLACPSATELFDGICWDEGEQSARTWIAAIEECSARGGRLPTLGELIAFVLQTGTQVGGENWSGDVDSIPVGKKELVLTSDETTRHAVDTTGGITLPYRCVFYPTNAG